MSNNIMSASSPQPMSGHFLWSDFTETHIPNLFTGSGSIPNKTLVILMARYIDPVTEQELGAPDNKIGHFIGGRDNYWVRSFGNPPYLIEFAQWDNPSNNNTFVQVHELKGYDLETSRTAQVKDLTGGRKFSGATPSNGLVTNAQWDQAIAWAENY